MYLRQGHHSPGNRFLKLVDRRLVARRRSHNCLNSSQRIVYSMVKFTNKKLLLLFGLLTGGYVVRDTYNANNLTSVVYEGAVANMGRKGGTISAAKHELSRP